MFEKVLFEGQFGFQPRSPPAGRSPAVFGAALVTVLLL